MLSLATVRARDWAPQTNVFGQGIVRESAIGIELSTISSSGWRSHCRSSPENPQNYFQKNGPFQQSSNKIRLRAEEQRALSRPTATFVKRARPPHEIT
eukprot:2480538-Pleurochrysis_carterae.AAC.2